MEETRGEQRLALRRARMAAAPPFLRGSFRPFFFGGALWAVAALAIWLTALAGGLELPSAFQPLAWHRHEMLFGFVGAIIAGFLLTAIPNWTGRLPIAGGPLAALFALWLAGRVAVLLSAHITPALAAATDTAFFLVLAAVAGREVFAAKNRNKPVVLMILLLGVANGVDHAAAAGIVEPDLGIRSAISLVVIIISLIGGRIVPSFTRNWMAKSGISDGHPTQPGRFDIAVIGISALALVSWISLPERPLTGVLLIGAGLLQLVRLSRWGGLRSAREPLLFILHVGYFWLPLGLVLLGTSLFDYGVPRSAAIHALTAGAMGTMILAVMTRATLGHTGRELKAGGATISIYLLVTAGAVLRVSAPVGIVDYTAGMEIAGLAWAGAFLLFALVYGPMFFQDRSAGAAG